MSRKNTLDAWSTHIARLWHTQGNRERNLHLARRTFPPSILSVLSPRKRAAEDPFRDTALFGGKRCLEISLSSIVLLGIIAPTWCTATENGRSSVSPIPVLRALDLSNCKHIVARARTELKLRPFGVRIRVCLGSFARKMLFVFPTIPRSAPCLRSVLIRDFDSTEAASGPLFHFLISCR